jgi:hypothetical protein
VELEPDLARHPESDRREFVACDLEEAAQAHRDIVEEVQHGKLVFDRT